jgi:hypothetical protein
MQGTSKRQVRPGRSPKSTTSAAPAPRRGGPRPTTLKIVERITELQMRQAPLETFAADMVPLLLDAFDAPAGALLLYGCESETLALLESRALSPAGRERLQALRRGAADSWEIPLHGLLNRKAYVIESPDEHPFVPELVDREIVPRTANLASIPLYRGQLPVGVVLVIADRRPILETEILTHVLAFDALALALDGYIRSRSHASGAASAADPAADSEALTCEPWVEPREIAARLERDLRQTEQARAEIAARLADAENRLSEIDGGDDERAKLLTEQQRQLALLTQERDQARGAAAETGEAVRELRATVVAIEGERDALRTAQGELSARAGNAAQEISRLETLCAALRTEETRLREERARVLAAVDEPGAEPAAVIRALREKIVALEGEIGTQATDRAELARRSAAQAEQVAQQLAAQRREVEELRATHERALGGMRTTHLRELEDERAQHARVIAEAAVMHERGRVEADAGHDTTLAALRAEQAETLARACAERDARRDEAEHLSVERDDLEARLTWALAEREEVAAAAAVRERAALAALETERRESEAMRAAFDLQRAAMEQGRADDATRLGALEADVLARDERLATAARETEDVEAQLLETRGEVARLREDRARVLAVVDDPGAEPEVVIQALRERVGSTEALVRSLEEEKRQAMQRAAAEVEQAEHRLAVQRRELAETRGAHRAALEEAQAAARREMDEAHAAHRLEREADAAAHLAEIANLHASADRIDAERRATLTQLEYDRDAAMATVRELRTTIAEREARLGELQRSQSELAGERTDVTERAAALAEELTRVRAALGEAEHASETLRQRVGGLSSAETERNAQLTTLVAEREQAEARRREAERRAEEVATELAVVTAEAHRLREDRARVLAAVDDDAEPVAVIRALREQVVALEGQLTAHASERSELTRLAAADARAMDERLAMVRAEREAAEAEHRRELESAEAVHTKTLEHTVTVLRREMEQAATAHRKEIEARVADVARLEADLKELSQQRIDDAQRGRAEMRDRVSADAVAPDAETTDELTGEHLEGSDDAADDEDTAASSPGIEVVQRSGHHILESDAVRWDQIHAALSTALPPVPGKQLMVANLLAAFPAGLYDLTAAAKAGATLVGYAADAHGRSRILGAVRCFADPPSATESAAVFDNMPKGPRRVLTLSEDVEAFLEAKAGLAKAGHSVSMACDTKQALDLLAMFTPDAVFVDLRTAPTAAAEFLAALAPENGRVLVVLVHGDPEGNVLPCVIQRLLRPAPLDPADLVKVCRDVLAGPSLAVARAPVKVIRPLERPNTAKALPRKPIGRRIVPRRR